MTQITSHTQAYTLTEKQKEFFDENGYLLLKNVFSRQEIDIIRKDMDDFAGDLVTNYLDMHYYNNIQRVHRGKKMCDIGDQICNDRAIPIGSIAFFCKPNNEFENGSTWHQDNYAGKSTPGSYINLALVVDDADESNGALKVVPGSHKLGDLPCNPKANFSRDEKGRLYNSAPIGNNCELPAGLPIVQLEYEAGDVFLVHGLTVHKAEKNTHPTRWRRTIYFVYVKNGEPFWPGWTAKRCLLERHDSPGYVEDKHDHT